jgi:hypothetical protein
MIGGRMIEVMKIWFYCTMRPCEPKKLNVMKETAALMSDVTMNCTLNYIFAIVVLISE